MFRSLRSIVFSPTSAAVRHHYGYIPFEGRMGRPLHEYDYFFKQVWAMNLKPVKRVQFSFDPFYPRVQSIRMLMHYMTKPKIKSTNVKCLFKFDVLSDGSEPTMKVELNEGKTLVFKAGNLSRLELVSEFNRHVLPLVTEDVKAVETKSAKTGGKGGKRR